MINISTNQSSYSLHGFGPGSMVVGSTTAYAIGAYRR